MGVIVTSPPGDFFFLASSSFFTARGRSLPGHRKVITFTKKRFNLDKF